MHQKVRNTRFPQICVSQLIDFVQKYTWMVSLRFYFSILIYTICNVEEELNLSI